MDLLPPTSYHADISCARCYSPSYSGLNTSLASAAGAQVNANATYFMSEAVQYAPPLRGFCMSLLFVRRLLPPVLGGLSVHPFAPGHGPARLITALQPLVTAAYLGSCCTLCSLAATIVGRILYNCLRVQATMHPRRPPMGGGPRARSYTFPSTWNAEMPCQVRCYVQSVMEACMSTYYDDPIVLREPLLHLAVSSTKITCNT